MMKQSSSTLTRPANTTAYAQNDLIATTETANQIVVPSFRLFGAGVPAFMRRIILRTNITTGMGAATFLIEFWSSAPTFTNGDNGAYAVATGASGWLGVLTTTAMTQAGDGAYIATDCDIGLRLSGSNDSIYWSLKSADAGSFTPISSQTFTLVAELSDQP